MNNKVNIEGNDIFINKEKKGEVFFSIPFHDKPIIRIKEIECNDHFEDVISYIIDHANQNEYYIIIEPSNKKKENLLSSLGFLENKNNKVKDKFFKKPDIQETSYALTQGGPGNERSPQKPRQFPQNWQFDEFGNFRYQDNTNHWIW